MAEIVEGFATDEKEAKARLKLLKAHFNKYGAIQMCVVYTKLHRNTITGALHRGSAYKSVVNKINDYYDRYVNNGLQNISEQSEHAA